MHRNKRSIIIGCLVLAAVWAVWCVFFLPRGIGLWDEGWYCSEAWRLAQGDLLFRDTLGSSTSLTFWWLSWVFRIFPECGLLGLRIIWAIVMLLCALVTANLMLRYYNPLVSFASAAAALFFVDAVITITTINYITMPVLPLLFAAWLWLTAYRRSGKGQLFLAAGAGAAAFLATTCKVTLVVVIFLPILTIIYDRCCGVKTDGLWRAAIVFFTTYLTGVVCFFLIIDWMGLIGDLFSGWVLVTSWGRHGLDDMAHMMILSTLFILLPGLLVASIAALLKWKKNLTALSARYRGAVKYRVLPAIFACIVPLAILVWLYLHKLGGFEYVRALVSQLIKNDVLINMAWVLFIFATAVIIADITFHLLNYVFNIRTNKDVARTHDRCRLGIMAVFLCLVLILGTNEFPARPAWANAWLLISLAVCLSCVWFTEWSRHVTKFHLVWLLRGVGIAVLLLFPCYAILRDVNPYDDRPVWELSASPSTARARGIVTTPERADLIDSLVDSVERNSEAGDRILVYHQLPMLYYLTDRLPSTNITWPWPAMPKSSLQSAVEDMIQRDTIPKVVVYYLWVPQASDDPIHEYVTEYYEVVQEVGSIQIMLPKAIMRDKGQ